ncbi:hypothetical protein ACGFX2_32660 [Streptomyces goshikiensis]|uniref:hypothetical protein n=1 Tax=Streptomyces goshikiensis TaxID=1942 RepID=UPI00372115D5
MVAKRPDGIYPGIGTEAYGRNLADAIENSCAEHRVVPPPRQAIIEGLATALPDTEIKGLIAARSGKKVLKPSAYRLVQAGDEQVLLLMCDVHGAAVIPWDLNDRTVNCWSPPVAGAGQCVKDLVAAELALHEARKAAKTAEKERETCRRAAGDSSYVAQALVAATQKHEDAERRVGELDGQRQALLTALGGRRPRPVVRAAEEDGEPKAALALAEQPYDVAVHMREDGWDDNASAGLT